MSVLDDLRAAEQRVAQRLKELEPAVAEYRELEAVAKRLGINAAEASGPAPRAKPGSNARGSSRKRAGGSRSAAKAAGTPSRSKDASGGRRRTPVGGREAQLLALVRARPGLTVRARPARSWVWTPPASIGWCTGSSRAAHCARTAENWR